MRLRWKAKYSPGAGGSDDIPSAMPVDVPEPADAANVDEVLSNAEYEQDREPVVSEEMDDCFGEGTGFSEAGDLPDFSLARLGKSDTVEDSRLSFVDTGDESAASSKHFAHVGRAAPDSVISEAIRLTDKKTVLYPWEKGRMSRIFGDRGRLEPKKPRLHTSSNSFVKLDVEVREGLQCTTAIGVRPTRTDDALFVGVMKQIIGGSYIEERDAKRDLAVKSWWDLLQLDMRCSDPGRTAMNEKGLVDIYIQEWSGNSGCFAWCQKSEYSHEKVVRREDLQPVGHSQHGNLLDTGV